MKQEIILVIKGMLIGLGKVIPGVSGSLIAVSLGVYEKAMDAISHLFQNFKKNIYFLGTLGIGILISIVLGSKLLIYLLEFCYVPTMFLFIGFIAGICPNLSKKVSFKNKKLFFLFFLALILVLSFNLFSTNSHFYPEKNMISYFYIIGIGFIDAATMIIPGISGTAIFMILGCYSFVLNLFASLSSIPDFLSNISYFFFFGIGLLIGIITVSKIMSFLFKKQKEVTYAFIIGFTMASILLLIHNTLQVSNSILELIIGIFTLIIGYLISRYMDSAA